jgi:hypothetical protein
MTKRKTKPNISQHVSTSPTSTNVELITPQMPIFNPLNMYHVKNMFLNESSKPRS